jgi:hypothetical protein
MFNKDKRKCFQTTQILKDIKKVDHQRHSEIGNRITNKENISTMERPEDTRSLHKLLVINYG